jgi:membrane peptidoglycan carboxypeptidase
VARKTPTTFVDAEEFLSAIGVEASDVPAPRRGFWRGFGGLMGVVGLATVAGVMLSLLPLPYLSAGVQAAEPALTFWNRLPEELEDVTIAERNTLYDVNGNVFAEVWSEDRIILESLDAISPYAQDALIDTEDKRFYTHQGVDIIGTARAALSGSGGGSGITQQLVKNLQFYNRAGTTDKDAAVEQTLARKLRELKISLAYEKEHSKEDILLQYFNTVSFGAPNIYSLEAAARYFFGKSAADLSLAEAAALVGTVQNPVAYNMNDDSTREVWTKRQLLVLDRMVAEGSITREEADAAAAEELVLQRNAQAGNCTASSYPFYCEYVLEYLRSSERLGETSEEREAILARGGLQIRTQLDPAAMDILDRHLEADFGNDNRVVGATAVVQPGSGGVQAMGANRNYGESPGSTTINLADTPAATGSTFKAITLAAALDSGMTEAQLQFASDGCPFKPTGFDAPERGFSNSSSCALQGGNLNYRQATALSSNTWYLTLATKVGLQKVFDMATALGVAPPERVSNRSLAYVIGATEYTPIQMAAVYATFANDGVYCPPTPLTSYAYADGSVPAVPDTYDPAADACRQVLSPQNAGIVLKSLRANTVPGEVNGAFGTAAYIPGYDSVGKSGTNENFNYVWAQVSKQYSLFLDIYDMDTLTNGVNGMYFRGNRTSQSPSAVAASDMMRELLAGKPNIPLAFDSGDTAKTLTTAVSRDMFTVPSVLGMAPAAALATLQATGMEAHVSVETRPATAAYPSGVVIEQSVEPGTELPVGTAKEVILYLTE